MSRFQGLRGNAPKASAQSIDEAPAVAAAPSSKAKAREGKVMVGGYFSPAARRSLHMLALDEGVTIQHLIGEGLDAILAARGMKPLGER